MGVRRHGQGGALAPPWKIKNLKKRLEIKEKTKQNVFFLSLCGKYALERPFPAIWRAFWAKIFLRFAQTRAHAEVLPTPRNFCPPWIWFCGRPCKQSRFGQYSHL